MIVALLFAAVLNLPSQPTLTDDFSGDSLNTNLWTDWVWSFPGRPQGFLFARDNVAVSNGCLNLTARLLREDEKTQENLRRGFTTYATAYVRAKTKTHYGYYECRAKGMKACVSNAFWLYDPLSDRPRQKFSPGDTTEEIDIFEIFGKLGSITNSGVERTYYMTVHQMRTPYLEGVVNYDAVKLPRKAKKLAVDFDFWADFHVYGFLWTPTELKWYIDGREVHARVNDVFHRPMHITFDCEIMYNWGGEPDPADLPAVYAIDYFRFYSLANPNPSTRP